jgi:hypothetical protein
MDSLCSSLIFQNFIEILILIVKLFFAFDLKAVTQSFSQVAKVM